MNIFDLFKVANGHLHVLRSPTGSDPTGSGPTGSGLTGSDLTLFI